MLKADPHAHTQDHVHALNIAGNEAPHQKSSTIPRVFVVFQLKS